MNHHNGSKVFWTALSTRRYRRLCQNGLEPQWQRAASIVWCRVKDAAALLFKKICPARPYSGGVAYSPRQNCSCQKARGQFAAEGIHAPCRNRAGRAERVFPRRKGLTDFEARRPTLPPLTVSRAQDGLTDFELRRPTLKIVSQKPFSAQNPGGRLCRPV